MPGNLKPYYIERAKIRISIVINKATDLQYQYGISNDHMLHI